MSENALQPPRVGAFGWGQPPAPPRPQPCHGSWSALPAPGLPEVQVTVLCERREVIKIMEASPHRLLFYPPCPSSAASPGSGLSRMPPCNEMVNSLFLCVQPTRNSACSTAICAQRAAPEPCPLTQFPLRFAAPAQGCLCALLLRSWAGFFLCFPAFPEHGLF